MQGIFRIARHLAIIALIARALLPMGWMPAAHGLTICSMDTGSASARQDGDKDNSSHEECPFAAAPHLASVPDVPRWRCPPSMPLPPPPTALTRVPSPPISPHNLPAPRPTSSEPFRDAGLRRLPLMRSFGESHVPFHMPSAHGVCAATLLSTLQFAQAQTHRRQPRTVIVTGERTEAQQPDKVETVTQAQAQEQINVVNTEDMLKDMPSIFVRKRHDGDTQDPVATRTSGVGESARNLIYVDGILVSTPIGNNNGATGSPHFGIAQPEDVSADRCAVWPLRRRICRRLHRRGDQHHHQDARPFHALCRCAGHAESISVSTTPAAARRLAAFGRHRRQAGQFFLARCRPTIWTALPSRSPSSP